MSRSAHKGPYIAPDILKKISRVKPDAGTVIKTWSRSSEISPEMVGYVFGVHNGKIFIEVRVSEEMVGHRLGEFSLTRKFTRHGGKIQKELEQQATAPQGGATKGAPEKKAPPK